MAGVRPRSGGSGLRLSVLAQAGREPPWAAGNTIPGAETAARTTSGRACSGLRKTLVPACFALAWLAACGDSPAPPPPAQPYTDPGYTDAGALRLHYALTPTLDLPTEIAGSYGIVQRRNLALLTITLVPRDAPGATRVAASELAATAISLTGLRTPLALARHDDAGGPTWLATVEIRHRVPVTIEIRVRATAGAPEIASRWTREFHLD